MFSGKPNQPYIPNQPYHPGLLNVKSAHANPTELLSDHVPVLVEVPNPLSAENPFKIVTWNVMELDAFNGFSENNSTVFDENDEQNLMRCGRIAEAIARLIDNQHPDFIMLQEVAYDSKIIAALNRLKPDFTQTYGDFVHNQGDTVTFYRKDRVQLIPTDNAPKHAKISGVQALFQLNSNSKYRIKLANAHHSFDVDTRSHEKSINGFLTETDSTSALNSSEYHTISIIAGDFNGSIASLSQEPHNTVTSAAPACFLNDHPFTKENAQNGEHHQGAYAIDGGFYSEQAPGMDSENVVCNQAVSITLNPLTGQPYTQDELSPLDTEKLNPFQANQVSKYRMCITVGQHLQKSALPNANESVAELLVRLRSETGYDELDIKVMSNLNNEQTLGFIVDNNSCASMKMFDSTLELTPLVDNNIIYRSDGDTEKLILTLRITYFLMGLSEQISKKQTQNQETLLEEIINVYNMALAAAQDPKTNKQALLDHLKIIASVVKSPNDQNATNALMLASKKAKGAQNIKLQALGLAMGVLGVAVFVLGALVLATCIIPLPHAIFAPVAGAALMASGVGLFASGAALIRQNRSKGLSDAMVELAKVASTQPTPNP